MIFGGVTTVTLGAIWPFGGRAVNDFSQLTVQAHVDDRTLFDLFQPGVKSGIKLFPEKDVPDLRLDPRQPFAFQRLLRFEAKDVIADRRPIGRGDRSWAEAEDLRLDVLAELTPCERPEVAAIPGAGVTGVLARELREVRALEQLDPEHLGTDAGRLP